MAPSRGAVSWRRLEFLGGDLGVERIAAICHAGVLIPTIPVAAHDKPQRPEVPKKRGREVIADPRARVPRDRGPSEP